MAHSMLDGHSCSSVSAFFISEFKGHGWHGLTRIRDVDPRILSFQAIKCHAPKWDGGGDSAPVFERVAAPRDSNASRVGRFGAGGGRLSVLSAPNTPNVRHDWRVLHFPAFEDHGWHGLTRIRNADPHMGEFGVCQYAGERRGSGDPDALAWDGSRGFMHGLIHPPLRFLCAECGFCSQNRGRIKQGMPSMENGAGLYWGINGSLRCHHLHESRVRGAVCRAVFRRALAEPGPQPGAGCAAAAG